MNNSKTKPKKVKDSRSLVTRIMKRIVSHSPWIPTIAVLVLYLSSILLVLLGIFKLYIIISDLVMTPNFWEQIDLIHILAQFIGIIEVYLLAIIFKIFAVGIFNLNFEEIKDNKAERIDSIEELKIELAKAIVLFLAVFLVQKVVLWDDGVRTLYYGIIITLICSVLIAFTMVLQKNIRATTNGEQFVSRKKSFDFFSARPLNTNGKAHKKPTEKKPQHEQTLVE